MRASAALRATSEGRRPELTAHALLTLTSILWGSSFVGVKLIVDNVPPMLLGLLRAAVATAVLAAFARSRGVSLRVSGRDFAILSMLGLFGIGYYYFGINLGIRLSSATNAALLSLPFPAMAALGAWIFLGERVGPRRALGIAVALAGATFLTLLSATGGNRGTLPGNLLILSTTLDWTAYTLLGRRYFGRWPGTVATTYIMLTGGLMLVPAAVVEASLVGGPRLTTEAIVVIAYLGLACTALAYIMWNRGIEVLGATRTSVYLYLQPVVAIVMAMPILGERLTWDVAAGGLLVVVGTVLVARR